MFPFWNAHWRAYFGISYDERRTHGFVGEKNWENVCATHSSAERGWKLLDLDRAPPLVWLEARALWRPGRIYTSLVSQRDERRILFAVFVKGAGILEAAGLLASQGKRAIVMSSTTELTFEEFENLPEQEGTRYELDEGELMMEPSPTFLHNRIRDRVAARLSEFVKAHRLGEVIVKMDFRLAAETVRNPGVAFVTAEHLARIDVERSPVDRAPALAVEVISPSNLAQDTQKKVGQYLSAGTSVVWVVYPSLRLVEVHKPGKHRSGQGA